MLQALLLGALLAAAPVGSQALGSGPRPAAVGSWASGSGHWATLLAAAAPPQDPDRPPARGAEAAHAHPPPPALVELQATIQRLSEVKLEEKGEAKVEAVRHRKGALAALAGAARPLLRGADVPARMEAHLALAEAHEAFARELFAVRPPAAATGGSVRSAWAEQTATAVERALETARAHLRSCVDLAPAHKETAARCGKLLAKVGAGRKAPKGDPAAVAATRMGELQGCFDAHAAQAPESQELELSARLSVDGSGRVEEVALSPRREDLRALYDCVADGLWIWTFPGVADVELELPIRLRGAGAKRER